MRGRTLLLIGILAAIVAGLLIFFNQTVTTERIVEIGGVIFVGAGLVNLLFFNNGNGAARVMTSICNAAAIIFGVCMLVFRSTFEPLIPFAFGLLITICAVWQFYALAIGIRPRMLPAWLYLFPILLVIPAIYIFLRGNVTDSHIPLITGISIAVFALGAFIEGCMMLRNTDEKKNHAEDDSDDLDDPAEPEEKKEEPKHEHDKEDEPAEPKHTKTQSEDADLDDEVKK